MMRIGPCLARELMPLVEAELKQIAIAAETAAAAAITGLDAYQKSWVKTRLVAGNMRRSGDLGMIEDPDILIDDGKVYFNA